MITRQHRLPVTRQCDLLALPRSSVYYTRRPVSAGDLALMRQIDALHLERPFAGSRIRDLLVHRGIRVGRKHVATLMRRMGIAAIYRHPRTSRPHPGHQVFPYLLRDRSITRPNHVWAMDLTYLPMRHGFLYLVAVLDWATRRVLAWQLSNTMTTDVCLEAPGSGPGQVRLPGDPEHGPGQPVHQRGVRQLGPAARHHAQHGWERGLARQPVHRAALEDRQV